MKFGLGGYRLIHSKKPVKKSKVRKVKGGSDVHSITSQDNWQTMKFKIFSTWKPYDTQTFLEKEQQALLSANAELNHQRPLFEEEGNHLQNFIYNEKQDILWLDVSGTFMETKRSTLGLCNDSVLAKQFDDPIWVQQDKTTSEKYWSCEEVAKWVVAIE